MKRRTQRIFISLLAFFIAWFAIANAYTFEVVNWSPFWVLNLQKLILKGWTTSTWIILDWKEYVIKIDPEHENNGWQIRVYEICDENGQNCREVSSLYTGTQGVQWPQWATWATWPQWPQWEKWATWATWPQWPQWPAGSGGNGWGINFSDNSAIYNNYLCRKSSTDEITCSKLKLSSNYSLSNRLCYVNENTLICDQANLFDELSGRINTVSGNIKDWVLLLKKWNTRTRFSANTGVSPAQVDIPDVQWYENGICVRNWVNVVCQNIQLWTMSWGRLCQYQDGAIVCDIDSSSFWGGQNDTWITLQGTQDMICTKWSGNVIRCFTDPNNFVSSGDLTLFLKKSEVVLGNSVLNRGSETVLVTIDGKQVKVKMPNNPDTWLPNAVNQSGYVAAPSKSNDANKVRKTDDAGNPGWRTEAGWTYTAWDSIRIDWNTISVRANALNQSGYVAAPSKSKDANKVRKTDNAGNPGWRDDATGWTTYIAWDSIRIDWNKISVIQNTTITSGYVTPPWTNTYNKYRWTNGAGVLGWHTISGNWSWVTLITWQNDMYCKYIVQNKDVWLDCTYDITSSWWDSLWTWWITARANGNKSSVNRKYITPKTSTSDEIVDLYFNSGTVIRHGWQIIIQKSWLNLASSPVMFDAKWARFGAILSAREPWFAWVSIAWELLIWNNWNQDNYVRVFSTWSYADGTKHAEMRASNELAVWIMDWAFIYFMNDPSANSNSVRKYRVWINNDEPQATLDVAWSIRVQDNQCAPSECNSDTVWSITFYNNKFYWCKKVSGSTYHWYEFNMTDSNSNQTYSSIICTQMAAY